MLTNPLRDRFGIVARLEFYTADELACIVKRSAGLLDTPIVAEGAMEIAKRSRGTPRIANRLLRRVRDYAQVKGDGTITQAAAQAALQMLDVDNVGALPHPTGLPAAHPARADCDAQRVSPLRSGRAGEYTQRGSVRRLSAKPALAKAPWALRATGRDQIPQSSDPGAGCKPKAYWRYTS